MTTLSRRSIFGAVAALFGGTTLASARPVSHANVLMQVSAIDGEGFEAWLQRGGAAQISRAINPEAEISSEGFRYKNILAYFYGEPSSPELEYLMVTKSQLAVAVENGWCRQMFWDDRKLLSKQVRRVCFLFAMTRWTSQEARDGAMCAELLRIEKDWVGKLMRET